MGIGCGSGGRFADVEIFPNIISYDSGVLLESNPETLEVRKTRLSTEHAGLILSELTSRFSQRSKYDAAMKQFKGGLC